MVRNLSSALLFPVHPLPCYAIRHSSNLLPTQPSKALLLLDLSSIQLSHYAINTNSVIWAIRVCVFICMLRGGGNYGRTVQLFNFFFFFPETAINQSAFKRKRLKASWEVESPGKPHRDPGSSGVNCNFHYSLWREGRVGWRGGEDGMNRERGRRVGGKVLLSAKHLISCKKGETVCFLILSLLFQVIVFQTPSVLYCIPLSHATCFIYIFFSILFICKFKKKLLVSKF